MPEIKLPVEIYQEIFNRLDFPTALRFRNLCKKFRVFHTVAIKQYCNTNNLEYAIERNYVELIDALLSHTQFGYENCYDILEITVRLNRLQMFKMLMESHREKFSEFVGYFLAKKAVIYGSYDIIDYMYANKMFDVPLENIKNEVISDQMARHWINTH